MEYLIKAYELCSYRKICHVGMIDAPEGDDE
jgi:hypothetical protein